MAITRDVDTPSAGKTQYTLVYAADTQKIDDTMANAAKNMQRKGVQGLAIVENGQLKDPESLTNPELFQIADDMIRMLVQNEARDYYIYQQQEVARQQAVTDSETNLGVD